jgi:hypothetical protein
MTEYAFGIHILFNAALLRFDFCHFAKVPFGRENH